MEGCSAPLVVKFADTQREKEQKKIHQMHSSILNISGSNGITATLGQNATTMASPLISNPPQQANPFIGSDAITPSSLQLLQQLQAVGLQHQHLMQGQWFLILKLYFRFRRKEKPSLVLYVLAIE